MKGMIVQTNQTSDNPIQVEAKINSDHISVKEAIIHIAAIIQAAGQSLTQVANQIMEEVKEDACKPIELVPNDK